MAPGNQLGQASLGGDLILSRQWAKHEALMQQLIKLLKHLQEHFASGQMPWIAMPTL